MGVDVVLDVVEELRLVRNLVEDHAVARVREEPDGIVAGDDAHVRALPATGNLWEAPNSSRRRVVLPV